MTNRPTIAVITDSFATYSGFPGGGASPVTVLPNRVAIDGQQYRENIDLSIDEALNLMRHVQHAPRITPPSIADYANAYSKLAENVDGIISLHASKEISASWSNAKAGALQVSHCPIMVIDSRTISAGQAMLVDLALELVQEGENLEEIARTLRSAVERTYSIYYVENTTFVFENRIIEPSHAILGAMVGVKPVLTVENGRLVAMEKVKTRAQAVERLVEFAIEFADMSDAVILQSKTNASELGKSLLERLKVECPDTTFPTAVYGASLAALIGADAIGLAVIEKREMDANNDI